MPGSEFIILFGQCLNQTEFNEVKQIFSSHRFFPNADFMSYLTDNLIEMLKWFVDLIWTSPQQMNAGQNLLDLFGLHTSLERHGFYCGHRLLVIVDSSLVALRVLLSIHVVTLFSISNVKFDFDSYNMGGTEIWASFQ